ncbi:acetoin utilization protein AcuC [Xylanibacillus composti]|uniref:Acetoin utilization protein AcuC n=1 Tax=Xylanibacillus composti TaxID=1572762 RepID=A0A8J4H557_9BACL|nr:acetoin utilization protein AcuC [Xylanibacillus composti]MDT9724169.1 acetoin utilization protein AcuC [Xylanibacillus composti]GIQ68718.1 acetoin utilization protein AcuC [Xylanibacillus composti]
MSTSAIYMYHPRLLEYRFGDSHPFNQQRLLLTNDLLAMVQALDSTHMAEPRSASMEELLMVHEPSFVEAVREASVPNRDAAVMRRAAQYGINTDDTPCFDHMHAITSFVVGGSLRAAEEVMSGRSRRALHLGGGLHHAMPDRGAGFCVYNDASVAIASIRRLYDARVLYIDTDVHHGDGVQLSFYADPNVMTCSIHETGKYLFPGTGYVHERGNAEGFGYALNMPVEPYTEDESWLACFEAMLDKAVRFFRPDVIVSQHGCDAHAYDPLSHVHCSMNIYLRMPQLIRDAAEAWCDGRWIALGGGGYDIWRVVPRAWSLLWLAMSEHPLIGAIQQDPGLRLPESWTRKWQPHSPVPLPETWLDDPATWGAMPRRAEITAKNQEMLELALQYT